MNFIKSLSKSQNNEKELEKEEQDAMEYVNDLHLEKLTFKSKFAEKIHSLATAKPIYPETNPHFTP